MLKFKAHDHYFFQRPSNHLRGQDCPLNGRENTIWMTYATHQTIMIWFLVGTKVVYGIPAIRDTIPGWFIEEAGTKTFGKNRCPNPRYFQKIRQKSLRISQPTK